MAHETTDRARRRLLKLGVWAAPVMVSLTAARAHAGRLGVTSQVKTASSVSTTVKSQSGVGAKAKVG
jgi:hypothetical protein